jgi:hypothetical protein
VGFSADSDAHQNRRRCWYKLESMKSWYAHLNCHRVALHSHSRHGHGSQRMEHAIEVDSESGWLRVRLGVRDENVDFKPA